MFHFIYVNIMKLCNVIQISVLMFFIILVNATCEHLFSVFILVLGGILYYPVSLRSLQTVCKPAKEEDHTEQTSLTEDTLQPVSKEPTLISFSWEMTREDDPVGTVVEPQEKEKETGNIEEDLCQAKTEENEMFVVEMTKTSISLVRGRGCDKTGCTFNDIIMVAESSTVTLGE